jgi:hypothetical protein
MALPANVNRVTIHGKYVDFAGVACTGTITFVPSAYQVDPSADTVLLPLPTTVTLNVGLTGTFQVAAGEFLITPGLIATDDPDLSPGFYYHVTETFAGQNPIQYDLLVPNLTAGGGPIEISDVNRQLALVPAPQIYVSTINGLSGNVTLPYGSPTASAVGDTTNDGAATTFARSDHRHAREGFGSVTAQTTFGAGSTSGVATTEARSDHTHGTPATPTAAVVGALANSNGVSNFSAGLFSLRPSAGNVGAVYIATDRATAYRDNGAIWDKVFQPAATTDAWTFAGHSYLNSSLNTYENIGRIDGVLKQMWDIEPNSFKNLAIAGSKVTYQGANQGGWNSFFQQVKKQPGKVYPYTARDGGTFMMWGINDLGMIDGATTQMQTAWGHAMRACISLARASTIKEETDSSNGFTGTWANATNPDQGSGVGFKYSTGAATGGVWTVTLPSDFKGEVVVLSLNGRPGVNGGILTLGGTALTGNAANGATISTDNIMPALSFSHCPVVYRIKGLTSANASQTITATVTQNSNEVQVNGWWIEAKAAPPVIVSNIPKLPLSPVNGYTTNYPSWTARQGSFDNDVIAFNTVLTNVVAEFDSMVQIADADSAMGQDATKFQDNLHPNELGAAAIAQAVDDARRRLEVANSTWGLAASNFVPAYKPAGKRIRRVAGQYYTSECAAAGSNYTAVAGDMFAISFEVTDDAERFDLWGVWAAAAVAGTTIRIGIWQDFNNTGQPDINLQEITASGALTVPTATGLASTNGGGYVWRPVAPGIYWKVVKFCTVGTSHTFKTIAGPVIGMPQTTAGDIGTPGAGWKLTGQGTAAFPTTWPSGATLVNNVPYVVSRRA